MKNILLVGAAIALLIGAYFIYIQTKADGTLDTPIDTDSDTSEELSMGVARDTALGYEFSYPDGPDGYITLEDNGSTDSDFVSGLTLMDWQEYEELSKSTDPREGPPAIHVRVYSNEENLHPPVWAMRHALDSNVELASAEPEEAVVGGANATHYVVDGLYMIDTYVVASGKHIYVLMGAYQDKDSEIYRDFQELVSSFTFLKPIAPQGKIDVRAVCEGALAYTTFPSGAEADAFVEACINGEHPEVIDKFISEQGLDGATI